MQGTDVSRDRTLFRGRTVRPVGQPIRTNGPTVHSGAAQRELAQAMGNEVTEPRLRCRHLQPHLVGAGGAPGSLCWVVSGPPPRLQVRARGRVSCHPAAARAGWGAWAHVWGAWPWFILCNASQGDGVMPRLRNQNHSKARGRVTVLTLPPPGTCLILSFEPHLDWTLLRSSFLLIICTFDSQKTG